MRPVSQHTLKLVLALEHALGDRLYADLAADDEGGLRLSLEFDIGNVRDLDASDLPESVRAEFDDILTGDPYPTPAPRTPSAMFSDPFPGEGCPDFAAFPF